jgi:SAM-dependent methyltransferase
MPPCRLCGASDTHEFYRDANRRYDQCGVCALIAADPATFLPPAQERAIYELHQNSPDDAGYRRFLSRLAIPLAARLGARPSTGLDFGCGPGPTLSIMLAEMGYETAVYDPYFAPDEAVLARPYDFVTCTEAIEHFYQPGQIWRQLLQLVKPGGWLGIMTKLATDDVAAFAQWHYIRDLTHVNFFSRATFHYLATRDGLALEFIGRDVILLQRSG